MFIIRIDGHHKKERDRSLSILLLSAKKFFSFVLIAKKDKININCESI